MMLEEGKKIAELSYVDIDKEHTRKLNQIAENWKVLWEKCDKWYEAAASRVSCNIKKEDYVSKVSYIPAADHSKMYVQLCDQMEVVMLTRFLPRKYFAVKNFHCLIDKNLKDKLFSISYTKDICDPILENRPFRHKIKLWEIAIEIFRIFFKILFFIHFDKATIRPSFSEVSRS